MSEREIYEIAIDLLPNLKYESDYISGLDAPYKVSQAENLRNSINTISKIDFLNNNVNKIKQTALFKTLDNEVYVKSHDHLTIQGFVDYVRTGLSFFVQNYQYSNVYETEDALLIKLPPLDNFDDLSKISSAFKKAIEIPILDSGIETNLKIVKAQPGSIWLTVLISLGAIKLVAAIVWSAAVIRRKMAESKIFEQHARTLKLKNDQIENIIDAQKVQIKNVLDDEAKAIAAEYYSSSDNEVIERLKLSINSVQNLIEKGAKILPNSKDDSVIKLFPDTANLSSIESAIKKISEQ